MTSRSLPINTGSAPGSGPALVRALENARSIEVGNRGERERERAYTELYRTDGEQLL